MFVSLARLVNLLTELISLLVIAQVILSYIFPPYHSVRQVIDRLVEPMLAPIRRLMPRTGLIDFSPMVLIILVQIIGMLLTRLLLSLA